MKGSFGERDDTSGHVGHDHDGSARADHLDAGTTGAVHEQRESATR